jgi:tRNA threonylcarbamoyl adenosine modification protein (Sua5/YciO/YrdC/YwlC family)
MQSKLIITAEQAAQIILAGGVGVMATDTVYGLVASAKNKLAVERFYSLKKREHKPGTVIAANVDQLLELGVPKHYLEQVAHLWPNSVSVVMPLGDNLAYLHQDIGSQPFRVVADVNLRKVLEQTGPLVTSSANQPGEPVANNIAEAQNYFGDSVDFYVDQGDLSGRASSTIVRVGEKGVEVLREGAVKL